MDLSYEETVQRIEKYKADEYARGTNHELCTIVKYPYHMSIYKGENKLLLFRL